MASSVLQSETVLQCGSCMGARPSDVKDWQNRAQNSNEMPLLRCVYYERDFYTRTAAKCPKTNHNPALAVGKHTSSAFLGR